MKKKQLPSSIPVSDGVMMTLNLTPNHFDSFYEKYSNGNSELSEQEQEEKEILNILKSLGFPMHETGTFLYKKIIVEAVKALRFADKGDKKIIKEAMLYSYSQFYFNIARNNLGMGIKSFHQFVSLSYQNRSTRRIKPQLAKKIRIDVNSPNYMLQAYKIADYYVRQKEANILEENENSYRRTTAKQKIYTMPLCGK